MGFRKITDEDEIEDLMMKGYAGEADEFHSADEGAVARYGNTVVSEIDGVLAAAEWDTAAEAESSYAAAKRHLPA